MNLALWLKRNDYRADQVQTFYPSPMATATAMYHSGRNPLKRITRGSESVPAVKGMSQRKLHKAFLRYHAPENWPTLRKALKKLGRADLIGNGKHHLVPARQPARRHPVVPPGSKPFATQHTGINTMPGRARRKNRRRGA